MNAPASIAVSYRTRLRELLTEHFDLEELRTLCVDLGEVDFENLGGEGKANKARDLVAYLERRGRLGDLIALCAQQRPHVTWEARPESAAPLPPGSYSGLLGKGLMALTGMMRTPQVFEAVVAFRTDFEAARAQIVLLSDYKELHDLLHDLQDRCYDRLKEQERLFPGDEMVVDTFMEYERVLQEIVSKVREITTRPSFSPAEVRWVADLGRSQEELARALETLDPAPFRRATLFLRSILTNQPTLVNERLKAAAGALRLPMLVSAMARISDQLTRLSLDTETVQIFETGVDALVGLNASLGVLVQEHSGWQAVDLRLRGIEASLTQDTTELEMFWPDLREMTGSLCGEGAGEWAAALRRDMGTLDSAISSLNPGGIRRYWRLYRRGVVNRFIRVDIDLKTLCQELRAVGEPLTLVMQMMESSTS